MFTRLNLNTCLISFFCISQFTIAGEFDPTVSFQIPAAVEIFQKNDVILKVREMLAAPQSTWFAGSGNNLDASIRTKLLRSLELTALHMHRKEFPQDYDRFIEFLTSLLKQTSGQHYELLKKVTTEYVNRHDRQTMGHLAGCLVSVANIAPDLPFHLLHMLSEVTEKLNPGLLDMVTMIHQEIFLNPNSWVKQLPLNRQIQTQAAFTSAVTALINQHPELISTILSILEIDRKDEESFTSLNRTLRILSPGSISEKLFKTIQRRALPILEARMPKTNAEVVDPEIAINLVKYGSNNPIAREIAKEVSSRKSTGHLLSSQASEALDSKPKKQPGCGNDLSG